jgi:membrane-associated phospholipid phosphatase
MVTVRRWGEIRSSEWLMVAYFAQFLIYMWMRSAGAGKIALAAMIPVGVIAGAIFETRHSRPWTRLVRPLVATSIILVAYRGLDWFPPAQLDAVQQKWAGWDHSLLFNWGLHNGIESFGWLLPAILETAYTLLYFVPPMAVVLVFLSGRGCQVDRFLTTLLAGTLIAYALLPHFPTMSPREAFPGVDLPGVMTLSRQINVWLLTHFDIGASVFPSGHVAVAFSVAFGLAKVIPERKGWVIGSFVLATCVLLATIYGRYHYTVDGLASLAISVFVWGTGRVLDPH